MNKSDELLKTSDTLNPADKIEDNPSNESSKVSDISSMMPSNNDAVNCSAIHMPVFDTDNNASFNKSCIVLFKPLTILPGAHSNKLSKPLTFGINAS